MKIFIAGIEFEKSRGLHFNLGGQHAGEANIRGSELEVESNMTVLSLSDIQHHGISQLAYAS